MTAFYTEPFLDGVRHGWFLRSKLDKYGTRWAHFGDSGQGQFRLPRSRIFTVPGHRLNYRRFYKLEPYVGPRGACFVTAIPQEVA
jgi:hypothetical protein